MLTAEVKYKKTGLDWMPEVPEHWEVRRTKNIGNIVTGATPASDTTEFWDGNINWITPAEFGNEMYISNSVRKITKEGLDSCNTTLVPKGSVVLSTRAPIGSMVVADIELCTNQGCKTIVPTNIDNLFLFYFLSIQGKILNSLGNGTTFKELSLRSLKDFKIPVPPLSEQAAIVQYIKAKEEKINLFIQKKQRFIELLKEQRQRIIAHAVTKGTNEKVKLKQTSIEGLSEIPQHWEVRRLKNVSKTISKGTTPSTIGSETTEEGEIRFLRAENLYENKITLTSTFYIDKETDELLFRSRLETNDVLLVIAGATHGRTGIVTEDILPANTNQAVCFIRPENVFPEFLLLWLQTNFIRSQIWLNATQAAQPNLAMGKISTFYILYPPIEEQKQIVSHIKTETATIDTAIAKAEREIELIREYKEAMIAEAVMGKSLIYKQ